MASNVTQINYKVFNDDNTANNASAYAAINTTATLNSYRKCRLRIQTYLANGTGLQFTLQAAKDAGSFSNIPTSLSGNELSLIPSIVSNATATTNLLGKPTGGNTFIAGYIQTSAIQTPSIPLTTVYNYTENEWIIIFGYLARGHTYTFHSVPSTGTPIWTQVPSITISADGNFMAFS